MGRPQIKSSAPHLVADSPEPTRAIVLEVDVRNAARAGAADVLSFRALVRAVGCVARRTRPRVADLNASLTRVINLNGALASKVLQGLYSE